MFAVSGGLLLICPRVMTRTGGSMGPGAAYLSAVSVQVETGTVSLLLTGFQSVAVWMVDSCFL